MMCILLPCVTYAIAMSAAIRFFFVGRVVEKPEIFPYKLRLKKFKTNFTNRPACLGVCGKLDGVT
jgi:hypothetical protein